MALNSNGAVLVMVGTTKGSFLFRGCDGHRSFEASAPVLTGASIPSIACDTRGGRCRILAGASSFFFGTAVLRSDDLGVTWSEPTEGGTIKFPEGTDAALKQ